MGAHFITPHTITPTAYQGAASEQPAAARVQIRRRGLAARTEADADGPAVGSSGFTLALGIRGKRRKVGRNDR